MDHAFDDLGQPIAGVGKGVEAVLAVAAAFDNPPVPQEGQVVAHSRLAHVKVVAQPPDMALPFGEQGNDLKSGRVADLLEENRCPLNRLGTQQGLVLGQRSFRGLLHVKDRGRHLNSSPMECDWLEAGDTSPSPSGDR